VFVKGIDYAVAPSVPSIIKYPVPEKKGEYSNVIFREV